MLIYYISEINANRAQLLLPSPVTGDPHFFTYQILTNYTVVITYDVLMFHITYEYQIRHTDGSLRSRRSSCMWRSLAELFRSTVL